MRHLSPALALGALAIGLLSPLTRGEGQKQVATLGTIERKDPRLDKLIAPGAVLEKLVDGHDWTEGPVWVKEGGYLLFSDIPRNSIYKLTPDGHESLFLKPSGYTGSATNLQEPGSNGLLVDPQGRLVLMEHGDRRVSRLEKDGKTKSTLADHWDGKRLNSPNDGVFKSNGDLYFTDPPYGRMIKGRGATSFPGVELDFCGVYRLTKDGKLSLLTKEMSKPNGITFSPDEKTLYVSNSDPLHAVWMAFPVNADGTLGKGKVFFDATKSVGRLKGLPDGMKTDKDGNLFAAGPGGILVFTPAGEHLGTIATGVATANCNWAEDGTVLYVAADKAVCRIKTQTRGRGW
jgi:gluconolactonase